jgi:hypothetical protein
MNPFQAHQADQHRPDSSDAHHAEFALNRYMNQPAALGAYRLLSMHTTTPSVKAANRENDSSNFQEPSAKEILKQQKGPNPILAQPFKR